MIWSKKYIHNITGEQEQCQHQRGRSSYEIQSREVWILGETSPENSIQERSSHESDYREPQAEGGQGAIVTVINWGSAFKGTRLVSQPPTSWIRGARQSRDCPQAKIQDCGLWDQRAGAVLCHKQLVIFTCPPCRMSSSASTVAEMSSIIWANFYKMWMSYSILYTNETKKLRLGKMWDIRKHGKKKRTKEAIKSVLLSFNFLCLIKKIFY